MYVRMYGFLSHSKYRIHSSAPLLNIFTLQLITGLTRAQASSPSFRMPLILSVAAVLEVPAEAILLLKIDLVESRRIALAGIVTTYIMSISSSLTSALVTSTIDQAVRDGRFADFLSSFSGIFNLHVEGYISAVTLSPTASPVAAPSSGKD